VPEPEKIFSQFALELTTMLTLRLSDAIMGRTYISTLTKKVKVTLDIELKFGGMNF